MSSEAPDFPNQAPASPWRRKSEREMDRDMHQEMGQGQEWETHQDTQRETHQDSQEETHQDSQEEMHQDSQEWEMHQDSQEGTHRDSQEETHRDSQEETRQDSQRETHQDWQEEMHQDTQREMDQDSREEMHQDTKREMDQDMHQDSQRDTHKDSQREMHQNTHQETHQDMPRDTQREFHQDMHQETDQDMHQDTPREFHQDVHQDTHQDSHQNSQRDIPQDTHQETDQDRGTQETGRATQQERERETQQETPRYIQQDSQQDMHQETGTQTHQDQEQDDCQHSDTNIMATERTPLISRASSGQERSDQSQPHAERSASASLYGIQHKSKVRRYRWPSLVALVALCIVAVLIIVFAFIAPSAVEQYGAAAVVFAPTTLSIDSFTSSGVRARVQGTFTMDSSRVQSGSARTLGKFCTWIAKEAETGETEVQVSLPEYGNVVLGMARIPGIKVYIRDGHTTPIDFLANLQPGNVEGIRRIANDYIDGRLGQLRVVGKADVPIKSGFISLGKQFFQKELTFANNDIPSLPKYDIQKLNFREIELPKGKGMAADVAIQVENPYPVSFTLPPLGFRVLVDNCAKSDPFIQLAYALTQDIDIVSSHPVNVNVTGTVRQLPALLTQACPNSTNSPLDNLVEGYLHGKETTIYVRGSDSPSKDTPRWITDLISDITIPVPVPGKEMGHLIKNFSLTDTHFSLPDPWATPGSPKSNPRITANVRALIALPEEMNFPLDVSRVRADADVFYKKKKLGRLDLNKWQAAQSHRVEGKSEMEVSSRVRDAPLEIQDQDVFEDVIQELIFGDGVLLTIKAKVDVEVETALGKVVVRGVEAEGNVPVKRPSNIPAPGRGGNSTGNLTSQLNPKLINLRILNTTASTLHLELTLNITNPTPYSAWIPYVDIHLSKNGSLLGHATAQNMSITPGRNSGLVVTANWEPKKKDAKTGAEIGRELISQYISSYANLTLGVGMHEESFPSNPILGRGLKKFEMQVPLPKLGDDMPPDDGDGDDDGDESPHFMKDAHMHLLSSTATFLLLSPLKSEILWIETLNATAFYEDEPAGGIFYEEPMGVLPLSWTEGGAGWETPRLPVRWKAGSVGFEAVKKALGGQLRLGAYAEVGVRIGRWREEVWFRGGRLGVRIGL